MAKRLKNLLLAGLLVFSQIGVALAAISRQASALVPNVHVLVSVDSNENQGTSPFVSGPTSISEDGRYVLFGTFRALVPDDTNNLHDLYVRDVVEGTTVRASVKFNGTQKTLNQGDDFDYKISANGRYVVFQTVETMSNEVESVQGGDVFIRDLQLGTTELISKSAFPGQAANGPSRMPVVSEDGRYVAFVSGSTMMTNPTTPVNGIYIRDRVQNTTTRINVTPSGASANNSISGLSMSCDGTKLVFDSSATNLRTNDTNGLVEVFYMDMATGQLQSITSSANSHSSDPSISCDGSTIVFASAATNLVGGTDTNNTQDTFTYDITSGAFERASVSSTGDGGNSLSYRPSISGNGKNVTFQSLATNLATGSTNREGVFLRNREAGTTEFVSKRISPTTVAFQPSEFPEISADGRFISYSSYDPLIPTDVHPNNDIYRSETGVQIDTTSPSVVGIPGRTPDFVDLV